MAGFLLGKMKRKEFEEVYDDFNEFSLSSPARKIRRLDAELPPIMEEEEPAVPLPVVGSAVPENVAAVPSANDERALVLYKPMSNVLVSSPSPYIVDSNLIPALKNQAFWQGNRVTIDDASTTTNNCLAVVPWVPSQSPTAGNLVQESVPASAAVEEEMEAEAEDYAAMDVEEERNPDGVSGTEGFHQWQQHCMIPQLQPNTSTPIMW